MYQILFKVIDQQYGQNCGSNTPMSVLDIISPLLSIDNDLRIWNRSLPIQLKTIDSSKIQEWLVSSCHPNDPASRSRRFQVVLTLRSLNVTILLHRRVLEKHLEFSSSSSLHDAAEFDMLHRLGRDSIEVLFKCSTEIISIVTILTRSHGPAQRLLPAWWFTLYYSELCAYCS